MGCKKGFSLIELLIVVAIILIIAAIAIPNLLRSRMAANEASAVESLRTINTAEITYSSTYPDVGFTALSALGGAGGSSTGAGLIDNLLGCSSPPCAKSGYVFSVTPGNENPASSYTATADPQNAQTGQRHFFTDASGVIRYDTSAPASVNSNPL